MLSIFGADTLQVRGFVGDGSSSAPLHGASVRVSGTTLGAATDSTGHFSLRLPSGRHRLEISFVGYAGHDVDVDLRADTLLGPIWLRPDVAVGGQLEVRGERSSVQSATVQVLDEGQIDRHRGQTLGETLSSVAGLDVLQTGPSIAKPVIRGLHSDRVVTMQGGLAQEGQQWGGEHAPEIDPFSPGRIEIVKGAAGVEYGIGAIGGVIRVLPRDIDPMRRFSGLLMANGYSNNGQGALSLNLEGSPLATGALGWRVQGSLRRAGDARTSAYVIDNSGFSERSLNGTLTYRHQNWNTRVYASHYGTELGIYSGAHFGSPNDLQRAIDRGRPAVEQGFTYRIGNPKQAIAHNLLSVQTSVVHGSHGVAEVQYGLQQNHRQEYDAHGRFGRAVTEPAFDLKLTTQTLDARYLHEPIRGFEGKLGFHVRRQGNVRRSTGFLIPDFRAYSGGLFLLEQLPLGDVTFEAGGRLDLHWIRVYSVRSPAIEGRADRWIRPSGTAGLVWQPSDAWTARMHVGTGWRPAGVNERFSRGVHHGTAQYEIGDPGLTPESATSVEAGFRYQGRRLDVDAGVYVSHYRDFIQLRPDGGVVSTIRGAFPRYLYEQGNARLLGSELAAGLRLSRFYTLEARASWVQGQHLSLDEPLYMMPPPRASLTQTWTLPDGKRLLDRQFSVTVQGTARQHRFPALVKTETYAEPAPPSGYLLFDAGFSQRVRVGTTELRLGLDLKNIFDTSYRDYLSRFRFLIDEPGRNLILRAAIPFGS